VFCALGKTKTTCKVARRSVLGSTKRGGRKKEKKRGGGGEKEIKKGSRKREEGRRPNAENWNKLNHYKPPHLYRTHHKNRHAGRRICQAPETIRVLADAVGTK